LKKYIKIDDPLSALSERIRKDFFKEEKRSTKSMSFYSYWSGFLMRNSNVRKVIFLAFLLSIGFRAVAPDQEALVIFESHPVEPFSKLMYAIGMVETMGNTMAYNELEDAAGIFQIRQVRLDDYNRRTGSHYTLKDMFNYEISEKVFLYFASKIGPYDFERIAKTWNGSGPKTSLYWDRIKEYL
jgi:hypothetical protein